MATALNQRPGWRRLVASLATGLLALWWAVAAVLYFATPLASGFASLATLLAALLAVNTLLLGLGARWVWRWQRAGVAVTLGILAVNVLLSINTPMAFTNWATLIAAGAAMVLLVTLMVRPEPA